MTLAPAGLDDILSTNGMTVLVLLALRVGGLVLIAPIFAQKAVPMKLRSAVMLLFAVVMVPVAKSHLTVLPLLTPQTFITETIIGFGLGLGSALVVAAASAAGDLMSVEMGLAGASVLDPMTNIQVPVLGQLMTAFVTLLLFASGGHLVMIDGLASSLQALPLGSTPDASDSLLAMAKLGGEVLSYGVLFASPVMGATMLANVALAILTRAAPQLQIISVAFPLQIATGLFTLSAALGLTAVWFGGWSTYHDGLLLRILGPLMSAAR